MFAGAVSCGKAPQELTVLTMNVRYDNPEDGENNWRFRRERVGELIRSQQVDLLGTQEVLSNQYDDLQTLLPGYASVGVGREDGARAGEFNAIFYRTERFDLYCFGTSAEACSTYMDNMRRNLRIVTDYAATSGKLPIMAETGMEGISLTNYFTATIAPLVETSPVAWILFWRNAWEPDKPNHFYLPYKGHPAEADFKNFIASDRILMNSDIQ